MRNAFRLWYLLFDSIAKVCLTSCFSEFSGAMEYLKLLNSFLDSMGSGAPPFASNSVLKSALGKSAELKLFQLQELLLIRVPSLPTTSQTAGKEKCSPWSES